MSQRLIPFGEILQLAPRELVGDRELPIMSITMHEGLIDQDQKFKKRIASRDTSTYKVVHRRKLVVGFPIDEGVLGFQNKYDAAAVSPAYDIWEETGSHQIDLNYFERILRSPFARMIYASKMRGTTNRRRTVPKEIFKQIMFPLPPLEEQKRIAGILDAADILRAKRREALARLDDLLQSTFLDMFGHTVIKQKSDNRVRTFTNYPLNDLVSFKGGGTPKKHVEEYWNGEIPWASVKDFKSIKLSKTKDCITQKGLNESSSNLIPAGNVIVPTRMALGKAAINQIDMAINQDLRALIPKVDLDSNFLLHAYLSQAKQIEREGKGATVKGITQDRLGKIQIPFPPIELQQRFAKIVTSVEEQKAKMRKHLEQLDDLFASLQQRAFRGDL